MTENKTFYLVLSDSSQHPARRTRAKAPTLARALEIVYERMPLARIWSAGEITDVEDTMPEQDAPPDAREGTKEAGE